MKDTKEQIFKLIDKMMNHDLRFGQVVSNVFYEISKDGTDPFYVTNEKFLEHLNNYINS